MLTTSVERLEGNVVKLTVTVPAAEVDAAITAAYKAVSGKVKIPGFRPGKAPRPMIDSMVGRDYVLAEATEELVNTTYPRALDIEFIRPIESPEMEELEPAQPGEDYTYVAQIDIRPELTLSSTEGFVVTLPEAEATQADIDLQIDAARERFATLEPVEDRGVQADDFVLLSFVGTVDGEPYEGNEVDKYLYEMGRGLMPVEFDDGILGAKPGDQRSVSFAIPDTSSNPDFVGKTAGFEVTVHEIKAKQLPPVDEEFATNMGFDSVDEMTADLKSRLDLQKSVAFERAKERAVREAAAERLEGEIPEAMIKSRTSTMQRDFMSMLDSRQLTMDQYLEATGVDIETLEADITAQAEQSVREDLALEAVYRAVCGEITDADVDEEIAEIAEATNASVEQARARWVEMGLNSVLHEQIMHKKALSWLADNVSIVAEGDESAEGTKKATKKKAPAKKKADKADESAESTEE